MGYTELDGKEPAMLGKAVPRGVAVAYPSLPLSLFLGLSLPDPHPASRIPRAERRAGAAHPVRVTAPGSVCCA